MIFKGKVGGGSRIRTHGALARPTVFKTAAFGRSAIPPGMIIVNTFDLNKGGRLVTYAARCIENELLMMIRQEKKILREVSLYEPIGTDQEGNHISLLDIISTEEAELIEQYLHKYYLSRLEQEVFLLTDDREREIILKRYGLCGNEPHTQKEVAAMMGISRSYVSRIEKKALEKLRSSYEQYM